MSFYEKINFLGTALKINRIFMKQIQVFTAQCGVKEEVLESKIELKFKKNNMKQIQIFTIQCLVKEEVL